MKLSEKHRQQKAAKRFDRDLGKLTSRYFTMRTAAQHMHRSMTVALATDDATFDRGNLNQSLHIQLEKLGKCKAEADRLRASLAEQVKKGHVRRLDNTKYTLWLDMLDTLHADIVKEDIRPQELVRKQEFGGESKILDMKSGAVLKG